MVRPDGLPRPEVGVDSAQGKRFVGNNSLPRDSTWRIGNRREIDDHCNAARVVCAVLVAHRDHRDHRDMKARGDRLDGQLRVPTSWKQWRTDLRKYSSNWIYSSLAPDRSKRNSTSTTERQWNCGTS